MRFFLLLTLVAITGFCLCSCASHDETPGRLYERDVPKILYKPTQVGGGGLSKD